MTRHSAAGSPLALPASGPSVQRFSVLIVDDDDAFARMVADLLKGAGVAVRIAGSGEAALAAVAAERPDVVLSDVWMPSGMSGWDLVERLIPHRLPVVLMSAVFLESRSPSFSFVRKQDGLDRILAAVRAALTPPPVASDTGPADTWPV